jgi:hypothetical protein
MKPNQVMDFGKSLIYVQLLQNSTGGAGFPIQQQRKELPTEFDVGKN